MNSQKTFRDVIDRWFLDALLSTPQGRHHVLSQVADAESSGEARVFEHALAKVDDPDLARMIRRHQADEIRHAELFYARVDATGIARHDVPASLKILDKLDDSLGNPLNKTITNRQGVMEAYLLLQVIEERAITQFGKFIPSFRVHDPLTAVVFEAVQKDEERHLLYCHAISKRYAPDEQTRVATLERLRRAEAVAFHENQLANVKHALGKKLIPGALRRFSWRIFTSLARLIPVVPLTSYAGSERRVSAQAPALQAA